jgi:hypothetical protein
MAPKRRRAPVPALVAGERLNRDKLFGNRDTTSSTWGWVETEVNDPSDITLDHCLRTCGLSWKNKPRFCINKHAVRNGPGLISGPLSEAKSAVSSSISESNILNDSAEDVIMIVSDTEEGKVECTKKSCRGNPFCLNHLGQDFWEDESKPVLC